jgi:hypothetical protein
MQVGGQFARKTERARGRWGDSNRIAPGLAPVLRDELTAVVAKQQYPRENGYRYPFGILRPRNRFLINASRAYVRGLIG